MSLTTRTPLRHAKPYPTQDAAETAAARLTGRSDRPGTFQAQRCPIPDCGPFHVEYQKGASEKPAQKAPKDTGAYPFPASVVALLNARDISLVDLERCCQMCAGIRYLEHHHRRLKGIGGSEDRVHTQCACNGVVLCRRCHRWAHTTGRLDAEAMGFIVCQAVDEPGTKGVMRFAAVDGGGTQWPSCDGRWLESAPEMREGAS